MVFLLVLRSFAAVVCGYRMLSYVFLVVLVVLAAFAVFVVLVGLCLLLWLWLWFRLQLRLVNRKCEPNQSESLRCHADLFSDLKTGFALQQINIAMENDHVQTAFLFEKRWLSTYLQETHQNTMPPFAL